MRNDQIHLHGFNCAYNVFCLYFQEEPLGFDRRETFRMNTRKNRGQMKAQEPKEDKRKMAWPCNRKARLCSQGRNPARSACRDTRLCVWPCIQAWPCQLHRRAT